MAVRRHPLLVAAPEEDRQISYPLPLEGLSPVRSVASALVEIEQRQKVAAPCITPCLWRDVVRTDQSNFCGTIPPHVNRTGCSPREPVCAVACQRHCPSSDRAVDGADHSRLPTASRSRGGNLLPPALGPRPQPLHASAPAACGSATRWRAPTSWRCLRGEHCAESIRRLDQPWSGGCLHRLRQSA